MGGCPPDSLECHAQPSQPGVSPRPDPVHQSNRPPRWSWLQTRHGLSASCSSVKPHWPSSYFFSSRGTGRGAGKALGGGSGSQSRNSWSNVLTVSGHSSITMWLPSSMSFRKARSKICRGHRLSTCATDCPAIPHQPPMPSSIWKSLLQSTLHSSTFTQGGAGGWPVTLLEPNSVFIHSTVIYVSTICPEWGFSTPALLTSGANPSFL